MWQRAAERLREAALAPAWLSGYGRAEARGDLVAGLTVGVMLVPQGIAYAVIAGVPPIYGLYAGLVPPVVYALLGTSRQLAVGPIAIDMLIVAAGVGALAGAETARYAALAVLLAAMTGALQLAMGAARLGFVADLLSRPVIDGFTTAAALIIGASQLGNLLGLDLGRSEFVHVLVREAAAQLGAVHGPTLTLGAACIALLAGLQWWRPAVPGALVVAALATAAAWAFGWAGSGIATIGDLPTGLPAFEVPPVFQAGDLRALLPTALTLALVQFMSVASLGRVFAQRHRYTVRPNRELWAVGAANAAGSFFQGIPVSGSFSRSAVNDQAGARTPLANVACAAVVALVLLFFTPLFRYLPMAALAAIIIVASAGLIDLAELKALFRTKKRDGALALFTALATLVVGIQEGLLLGVGASVLLILYRISRPNMVELGHLPGTRAYRDLKRRRRAVPVDEVLVLRMDAPLSFVNAEALKDFMLEKARASGRPLRAVVIDGSSIIDLDTTGVEALESVLRSLEGAGVTLCLAGLHGPVRETVARSGLRRRLGDDHFFRNPHRAVEHLLRAWDRADGGERLARYRLRLRARRPATPPAAPKAAPSGEA